jgi:hypothetical protein
MIMSVGWVKDPNALYPDNTISVVHLSLPPLSCHLLNINKVMVAGHVGSVEIRYTGGGDAVLNLSIATVTTRGFGEKECRELASMICDICDELDNQSVIDSVKTKVLRLHSKLMH